MPTQLSPDDLRQHVRFFPRFKRDIMLVDLRDVAPAQVQLSVIREVQWVEEVHERKCYVYAVGQVEFFQRGSQ
ncbi:hypothetical protein HK097_001498 [Rhizophlyctis rosea]|uniref:Uncharacterized protein n=1 Tax=Rhizophlyctis rosea TaxID=64517 RepID=A0AAD5SLL5_9FUNG|nr:hypothetical protein HK097_001498 [Rhizophlyctis rosea]